MSKYDGLFRHLSQSGGIVEASFDEVETILGVALPASARRYPAWWSNSGGTHVQAEAWMGAGYRTEDVDVVAGRVRFVPDRGVEGFGEMKQARLETEQSVKPGPHAKRHTSSASEAPVAILNHPAFGALKGMLTLDPDHDYTQPADPDWGKVYED